MGSYTTRFALTGPFEVSGTISVGPGTAMDSDVNDPSTPPVANDSPEEGQLIPAPATVGGYLNSPGAGALGNSKVSGDVDDWFRTGLPAGASVTLFIGEDDGAVHDLDLLLYDVSDPTTPVDSSMDTGIKEQVTAPVRFTEMVEELTTLGVSHFLEVGPGRVLSGLLARIQRRAPRANLSSFGDLQEARSFLEAVQG